MKSALFAKLAQLSNMRFFALGALLLAFSGAQLRADVGGDNPTGVAGAFNGQITTGCDYDAYTGNATRSCTDIAVTSVGEYPLALVRTANSRGVGQANTFGLAGHWNHNYNWILEDSASSTNSNFQPSAYTVDFPDGQVSTFKQVDSSWDTKWRVVSTNGAPLGVQERFQPLDQNLKCYLFLPDGGKVEFLGALKSYVQKTTTYWYYSYVAQAIVDPHGLRTNFSYNNDGTLQKVTEPAGRCLQFTYGTPIGTTNVITSVTEVINGINKRVVQYNYSNISPGGQAYVALAGVGYYGQWTASYTYSAPNVLPATGVPLLKSCDDPLYAGRPMHKIAYVYQTGLNQDQTPPVYGQIQSENYYNGTVGGAVSTMAVTGSNPPTRQETRGDGSTRTFTYGTGANSGFLMNWTDFMGNTASQGYDSYMYVNSVTDRNSHTTNYTCDAITGNVTQVQFPAITHPSPAPRGTLNYTYTNNYYLYTSQDEAGNTRTYKRDVNNRVYEIDYPDYGIELFSYDSNHLYQPQAHTMTTGGVESWTYDTYHRKATYRNPDTVSTANPTTRYGYEDHDWVSDATGVLGSGLGDQNATTSHTYNLRGQMLTTTSPLDEFTNERRKITNAYNPDGTLQSKTDHFNGIDHTTNYTYDDYRRPKTVVTPDRGDGNGTHTSSFYYDANGTGDDYRYTDSNVTWLMLPSGKKTNTHYDNNRRKDYVIVGVGSGDDAKTSYSYDNGGNLIKVTAPEQQPGGQFANTSPTQTDYDERNRPWRLTDALSNVTTTTYDAVGHKKTVTRPNGQLISYDSFDQMNRVTQRTATAVGTTTYTYYPGSGLLHTFQDPRHQQYGYTYDSMGRKQWVIYPYDANQPPVQSFEYFTYDTSTSGLGLGTGTLRQYLNRNGKTQTFAYDNLNRMVSFSWNDSNPQTPSTIFQYDGASRPTMVMTDNWNITIYRHYFDDNLLKSETEDTTPLGGSSKTVNYAYDADGNEATITYPDDSYSFTYNYTGRNQVHSIWSNNQGVAGYGYNRNGDLTSRSVLPNGSVASSYTYDALDRVTNVTHPLHRDHTRTFDYAYDSVGNRLWSKYEDGYGDVFGYDLNDQVTAVQFEIQHPDQTPVGPQTIFYDAAGNRTVFEPYDLQWNYASNGLNQYLTRTPNADNPMRPTPTPRPRPTPIPRPTPPGQQAATYDYTGNMTTGFDGSIYTYDAQNRLISATSGSFNVTFAYDGLNRQVMRTGSVGDSPDSGTAFSVWDGWNLIEEYQRGNNVTAQYLYGPGGLIKNLTSGNYYFQDGSGNTSHLTDDLGYVIESYLYDVQGAPMIYDQNNNLLSASAYGVRHLFTGQQWYQEIGLYDLRNRFYSPDIGRFLQADPIGFNGDTTNLYRYCGNNPVTRRDSFGTQALPFEDPGFYEVPQEEPLNSTRTVGQINYERASNAGWFVRDITDGILDLFFGEGQPSPSSDLRDAPIILFEDQPVESIQATPGTNLPPFEVPIDGETPPAAEPSGPPPPAYLDYITSDAPNGNTPDITNPVIVSAPPLTHNEQLKLTGLARLARLYNPYWGYLPTTNTMNWAGGRAGPNVISTWQTDSTNSPTLSNFGDIYNFNPIGAMEPGIGPGSCFVAGTPVLMANGTEKPIETIQVGEAVLAWNEETKQVFSTKVIAALHHAEKMQTLFDIELEDGRSFTVNNDHPMYVAEDQDFVFTDELAARFAKGKAVTFLDSMNQSIRIASLRMRSERCKMYNIHVEGQGKNGHTYYANGILVHNAGAGYRLK
jgi:RHS repeat-associated protein